jgi:hypothetical protein
MMKRFSVASILTMLVAIALPAIAAGAPQKPRSVTQDYVAGGIDDSTPAGTQGVSVQDTVGGVEFEGGKEARVSISIADLSGQPVAAIVVPEGARSRSICGASEKPIKVIPGAPVKVFLFNGSCGDGQSVVTAGTVTATFGGRS